MSDPIRESFFSELAQAINAPILRERSDLEPFARDFSGLHTSFPLAVARAHDESEVARTFRVAARHGVPVTLRGAGHSSNATSLSNGGLVVRNFEPGGEMNLDASSGLVTASARCSWLELQDYLVSQGRACPVLTDFLLLSIGGTLSVGGYGARSIVSGAQIDNVERLQLVLPSGEALWCSRTENAELFRLALAGQGAVGAIERAVMRTIAHRDRTRIYGFDLAGVVELAQSLEWLETWTGPTPDWFVGALRFRPGPEFTVAQYGFDFDQRRPIDASLLTPLAARQPSWIQVHDRIELRAHARTVDLVDGHDGCVRVWSDYMFGYSAFVQFARQVEECLRDERFRRHLSVIGLLIHRSPETKFDFPFAPSLDSLGLYKYMVGFYFFVPSAEPEEISHVGATLRELLNRCVDLGGRPYRYGIADLNGQQRQLLYGLTPESVSAALARHGASWSG